MIESSNKDTIYTAYKVLSTDEFLNNKEAITLLNKISIFDKIRSYSDVCKELKIKELLLSDFSFLPVDQQLKTLNFHKLKNIEKLFNENWKVNWADSNQTKWYPWFRYKKSLAGLGFIDSGCNYDYSYGAVAFFKDEKTSNFIGKTFIDVYKGILE